MKHWLIGALLACSLSAAAEDGHIPMGYVVRVDSGIVYLDWGQKLPVRTGDRFEVFRLQPELKHPITGESLGRPEEKIGVGSVTGLSDKFSWAKMSEEFSQVKAGDRTRWIGRNGTPQPTAQSLNPTPYSSSATLSAAQRWQSPSFPNPLVGMTLADIDGDGGKDVLLLFADRLDVFHWRNGVLESVATIKDVLIANALALAAGDPGRMGKCDIFISVYPRGFEGPQTHVFRFENGGFHRIQSLRGFVHEVASGDGTVSLYWQDLTSARFTVFTAPALLEYTGEKYKVGAEKKVRLFRDDQLFGFTWGDWQGDSSKEPALLDSSEHLRVRMNERTWVAHDSYGGTRNVFRRGEGEVIAFEPRLIPWRHGAGKKEELLVPRNIAASLIRFSSRRGYKNSEIVNLAWDGKDMTPEWRLALPGYLADFAVGDGLGDGSRQLWVAVIDSADNTTLTAYSLP